MKNSNVLSREIPLRVINKNATSSDIIFNLGNVASFAVGAPIQNTVQYAWSYLDFGNLSEINCNSFLNISALCFTKLN
jgi:hypothetical protein